jgi:hypothetical protein
VGFYIGCLSRITEKLSESRAGWLSHFAVDCPEAGEKGVLPFEGFINELVDDNQVAWGKFFSERADGASADYGMNAEGLQREDICCERDVAGREFMPLAVPIEKSDFSCSEPAEHNRCARPAEGGPNLAQFDVTDLRFEGISQPSAAYYAY